MTSIGRYFTPIEKAVLICCLAALAYFAGGFLTMQKSAQALPPVFESAPQSKNSIVSTNTKSLISVHVAGAVGKPGVLRLPGDARVSDAIKLAGGASKKADLNSVNLAQKLKDGEQVLVRERGEVLPALPANLMTTDAQGRSTPLARSSSAKLPARPVNVNNASSAELETLPGIGPKTAANIMARRAKNPFRSLNDLDEVKGLGPKKLEKLRPYVTF